MNSNIIFGVDRIILVKYIVSSSGFIWEKLITILQLRDSNWVGKRKGAQLFAYRLGYVISWS